MHNYELAMVYQVLLAIKTNWRIINAKVLEMQKRVYVPGLTRQPLGTVAACDFCMFFELSKEQGKWIIGFTAFGERYEVTPAAGKYPFNSKKANDLLTMWWKVNGEKVSESVKEMERVITEDAWKGVYDNFTISDRIRQHRCKVGPVTFQDVNLSLIFEGMENMRGRFTGELRAEYCAGAVSLTMREVMTSGLPAMTRRIENASKSSLIWESMSFAKVTLRNWSGII